MFFSIPESSKARIPQIHWLREDAAGTRNASFDAFRFVLDDGGGWTLNGPLPRSNGWSASPRFPIYVLAAVLVRGIESNPSKCEANQSRWTSKTKQNCFGWIGIDKICHFCCNLITT